LVAVFAGIGVVVSGRPLGVGRLIRRRRAAGFRVRRSERLRGRACGMADATTRAELDARREGEVELVLAQVGSHVGAEHLARGDLPTTPVVESII
jgi:hypothetical protein